MVQLVTFTVPPATYRPPPLPLPPVPPITMFAAPTVFVDCFVVATPVVKLSVCVYVLLTSRPMRSLTSVREPPLEKMPPPAALYPLLPIAWLPVTWHEVILRLPLLYTAPPFAADPLTIPPVSVRFCSVRDPPEATSNRRKGAVPIRAIVSPLPAMVMLLVMTGKALLVDWYEEVKSKVVPEANVIVVAPPAVFALLMAEIRPVGVVMPPDSNVRSSRWSSRGRMRRRWG